MIVLIRFSLFILFLIMLWLSIWFSSDRRIWLRFNHFLFVTGGIVEVSRRRGVGGLIGGIISRFRVGMAAVVERADGPEDAEGEDDCKDENSKEDS